MKGLGENLGNNWEGWYHGTSFERWKKIQQEGLTRGWVASNVVYAVQWAELGSTVLRVKILQDEEDKILERPGCGIIEGTETCRVAKLAPGVVIPLSAIELLSLEELGPHIQYANEIEERRKQQIERNKVADLPQP